MPKEPYSCNEARRIISQILQTGAIVLWDHATDELRKDGMTPVDATNVLRCGRIYEEAEQRGAAWRYRVHTDRMCVVVQFEGADELAIVTAWRKGR